jgi:hypothetical protein
MIPIRTNTNTLYVNAHAVRVVLPHSGGGCKLHFDNHHHIISCERLADVIARIEAEIDEEPRHG